MSFNYYYTLQSFSVKETRWICICKYVIFYRKNLLKYVFGNIIFALLIDLIVNHQKKTVLLDWDLRQAQQVSITV